MEHSWRTVTPSNDPRHWIKGTIIDRSIPHGFHSRWAIYAVRTISFETDGAGTRSTLYDVRYRVHDATTVTDAEVRQGVEARAVGSFATLDEAERFILNH